MKEILSLTKVRLPVESDYNLIGSQNVTKHPFHPKLENEINMLKAK